MRRVWDAVSKNSGAVGDLFETITQSFYTKLVGPGDLVLDGGAHSGRHAIPLARLVGPGGRVLAFEPLPSVAARLEQLLKATQLEGRVSVIRQALARESGIATFFSVDNMPEFSGLKKREYGATGFAPVHSELTVKKVTIDEALDALGARGRLSFIKLDLEGGEFNALRGAPNALREDGPLCVFENGLSSSAANEGYSSEEFFSFFRDVGYELYDIFGSPVVSGCWDMAGPWYFVAIPGSKVGAALPALRLSGLELLLTRALLPQPQGELDPSLSERIRRATRGSKRVVGHVDEASTWVRIKGWAGDSIEGNAVKAVVCAFNGRPVWAGSPNSHRPDVSAAAGLPGFEQAGFDAFVRLPDDTSGSHVEVYAEATDGSCIKLPGR